LSKYKNRKITTEDGTFDSLHEYERWCELKLLKKAGEIHDLERQVKFVLIPTQKDDCGKVVERECSYIADFVYLAHDKNGWFRVVEDAKGMKTDVYKIKRKLMMKEHGIRIKEV
jgi:hypothetical protein